MKTMKTIKTSMLVKRNGQNIPLPTVGESTVTPMGEVTGIIRAVRQVGRPRYTASFNGQFSGHVQAFEMDVEPWSYSI